MLRGMNEPEGFFRDVVLRFWERTVSAEATDRDVAFLVRHLGVEPPARLLDVPSGAGRHALVLARRSLRVTAIDLSRECIEALSAEAVREGLPVDAHVADMRAVGDLGPFDGALSMGNSFGYLDHEGHRAFFAAVARTLTPHARFVLDTSMAAESVLPALAPNARVEVPGIALELTHDWVAAESRLVTTYRFVEETPEGPRTTVRRMGHAIYTVAEIERMLAAAGLEVTHRVCDTDDAPFTLGAPRLLLVARRGT